MEFLRAHWPALAGVGVMCWVIDRFLVTLTALAARSETGQGDLLGMVHVLRIKIAPTPDCWHPAGPETTET
jgi:hypothetical protein